MEYTEQQKAEFKTVFARRRRNQVILAVPVLTLMALLVLSDQSAGSWMLGLPVLVAVPVALLAFVGALLFSLRNWRCPACNGYLGKGVNPRFCAKCGVALR